MDVASEDSVESNYTFPNCDCCGCPCSLVTSNQESSKFNWRQIVWRSVSICSVIVSVACLATLVCMAGNSKQGTTTPQETNNNNNNELLTKLHKLNKSVHQNRKHIAATRRRLEHSCLAPPDLVKIPDYNKSTRVTLACGGLIPLPPAGYSILLDYKSQKSYQKNEKCLWILDSSISIAKEEKCYAKIEISVLCEGFGDEDDEIFVFDWIEWERLTSFELRPAYLQIKDYSPSNSSGWHFLSFTSTNTSATVKGTGFILRPKVLERSTYHFGANIAVKGASGNVKYEHGKKKYRFAMVFNPPLTSYALILEDLKSIGNKKGACQDHDSLHIFTVGRGGSSTKLPLLCGTLKKLSYVFQDPAIVAFPTSSSSTEQGFKLSWSWS